MDEENLYHKVQEALRKLPENFNVLEEQIDVQLQMDYFGLSGQMKEEGGLDILQEKRELLYDPLFPEEEKKRILIALAASGSVEDFRWIEKYLKTPDAGLKEWAILAFQECRMLMQSSLLDEQQVFISTGLGGKGKSLRYFVVFLNKDGNSLTALQRNLLKDELKYSLEQEEGELEDFQELIDFTTATVILPIKAPLKDIFRGIIDECNQYGNFLEDDMVITNVKKLNPAEILDILQQQRANPEEESD